MSGTKSVSLPTQMAIGLFLGVLCGVAAQKFGWDPQWFKPLGQLFINLVRMVVVPLVLVTLISGAASVGDVSRLGRVAGKTLVYYFVTTAVAIISALSWPTSSSRGWDSIFPWKISRPGKLCPPPFRRFF